MKDFIKQSTFLILIAFSLVFASCESNEDVQLTDEQDTNLINDNSLIEGESKNDYENAYRQLHSILSLKNNDLKLQKSPAEIDAQIKEMLSRRSSGPYFAGNVAITDKEGDRYFSHGSIYHYLDCKVTWIKDWEEFELYYSLNPFSISFKNRKTDSNLSQKNWLRLNSNGRFSIDGTSYNQAAKIVLESFDNSSFRYMKVDRGTHGYQDYRYLDNGVNYYPVKAIDTSPSKLSKFRIVYIN